jgi:hypothetical protein
VTVVVAGVLVELKVKTSGKSVPPMLPTTNFRVAEEPAMVADDFVKTTAVLCAPPTGGVATNPLLLRSPLLVAHVVLPRAGATLLFATDTPLLLVVRVHVRLAMSPPATATVIAIGATCPADGVPLVSSALLLARKLSGLKVAVRVGVTMLIA